MLADRARLDDAVYIYMELAKMRQQAVHENVNILRFVGVLCTHSVLKLALREHL